MAKKNSIHIKIEGMDAFMKRVEKANTSLKSEVSEWLEASGMQFLEEVVDTRRLMN